MTRALGTFRAFYLVALCCVGSFLFAYDTGIVGGILTFPSFQRDFRYTTKDKANVGSLSTSLLQAGAFFSCFFIWPFTALFGRRWSLVLASAIFNIGAVVQTINTHHLAGFYIARFVSAEMAPKNIRGMLGSMFQFFFTLGVMTSYWVDYAASIHIPDDSSAQWQLPVGLQLVPGTILGLGMLFTKESTRWLAKSNRREEALQSLIWVRGGDAPEVQEDWSNDLLLTHMPPGRFDEIVRSIDEENSIKAGLTWKELIEPVNRYRLGLIIALQIDAPQIFGLVGAGQDKLLLTGFFGLVKVVACLFFLLFLVERIGRRGSLLAGAGLMGTYMLIVAILTVKFPPNPDAGLTPPSIASLTMIYLEAMSYNISWGPVPWVYTGEIFSSRTREAGIAISTSTQWLFNFVFSQATPHAVTNLGWRTFLMFSIFNFALVIFVWFFIMETKGKSLEEMEDLFARRAGVTIARPIEDGVASEKEMEREAVMQSSKSN
ncbi:quinate transport [Fusarium napiforme]|uniref:Quinate transport n=1 Tax=Fusarium napiforme TaxID=42672 RepID=A0A8H5JEW8_9HYPO|nr:quinate transport [Fusarium napiforme]